MAIHYELTGIILQKKPFQEYDLLITILSPEFGLVRAIAPGARKHQSRLRGRTELLLVNRFFLSQGRNLDRIIEIETIESYPHLSQNIGKLTVSQYLAELSLNLADFQQPQSDLFTLLKEHLKRIEKLSNTENLFPYIAQGVFHLLAISGIAPNFYYCLDHQTRIKPIFNQQNCQVGFSFQGGGIVSNISSSHHNVDRHLNALELAFLQSLSSPQLLPINDITSMQFNPLFIEKSWIRVERILKDYIQFYLGKKIKSAELISDILITF